MDRKHYKDLWLIRFEKMLQFEKDAAKGYTKLMKKADCLPKPLKIKRFIYNCLEEIYKDEKRHAALVRRLIKIAERQPG